MANRNRLSILSAEARFRRLAALDDAATQRCIDNQDTPEGDAALKASVKLYNRCLKVAEQIWSQPVRSWADVTIRGAILEHVSSDFGTSPHGERARKELLAAIRVMAEKDADDADARRAGQ